jgi:ribosomal-protein-alanine N-acetyltransferase
MFPEVEHITIERMSEDDVDEVVRLERLCFSDPWSKRNFEEELKHRFSIPLVVKSGTKVVGYTCLWHIEDQMEIANFAISPEFRGKGIGRMMIERVFAEAKGKGCLSVMLSVRESNLAALNLYAKSGFVEVDRRKNYYRHPTEDAIIMVKNLERQWTDSRHQTAD